MNSPTSLLDRKPARKVTDVPADVLHWLNQGAIPTKNLTEWLAINHVELIGNALPFEWQSRVPTIRVMIESLRKPSTLKITNAVGSALVELASSDSELESMKRFLLSHPSDSVRCYYGPLVAALNLPLKEQLGLLRPLAADEHFGCREVAFFAFKPSVVNREEEAISLLEAWVEDGDENIRRFAVETTRPIGVWTTHLPRLKEQPSLAISLLSPLKADPSRYVQNAVANWLNDAAKSQPNWVSELLRGWEATSDSKATAYIVKRGARSL